MDKQRRKDLVKLAKMMNKQTATPLPLIKEVIDCFDVIVTPEDNQFLLKVGNNPRSYEELLELSGKCEAEFEPYLRRLLSYDLLLHKFKPDGSSSHYQLPSIFVGWFEVVMMSPELGPERQDFGRRMHAMLKKLEDFNFFPLRQIISFKNSRADWMRSIVALNAPTEKQTIAINRPVESPADTVSGVQTPGSVFHYIDKFDKPESIALCNCFCRTLFKLNDDPCRYDIPIKACIILGGTARQMVEVNFGEFITAEQAKQVVLDCHKKGAILNVLYEHQDLNNPEMAICNCCADCCGVWGMYNRARFSVNIRAYNIAVEHPDNCVGCGKCVKFCPTAAITLKDGKSHRDLAKCIGCGQCAYQCPNAAVTMAEQDRRVYLPIQPKSKQRF